MTTPCLTLPLRTEAQARAAIDLSRPSYRGAYHFAREAAVAHARAYGRETPGRADKAAGDAVMTNLLWHVEASDGGFMGLSDTALESMCERKGYDLAAVTAAVWAPTPWPNPESTERNAA